MGPGEEREDDQHRGRRKGTEDGGAWQVEADHQPTGPEGRAALHVSSSPGFELGEEPRTVQCSPQAATVLDAVQEFLAGARPRPARYRSVKVTTSRFVSRAFDPTAACR